MEQKQVYIIDTCALRKPNALEILRPLVEAGHEVAVPYQVHRELLRQQGEQALRPEGEQALRPEAERSQEPDEALGVIDELGLRLMEDTLVDGPADREIFCYCMENCNNGLALITKDYNLAFTVMEYCPGVRVYCIGEQGLAPFLDADMYKLAKDYGEIYVTAAGVEQLSASAYAWGLLKAVADQGGRVMVPSHARDALSQGAAEFCARMEKEHLLKFLPKLGPCSEQQALRARLLAGVVDCNVLLLLGDQEKPDRYRVLNGKHLPCMKRVEFTLGTFAGGKPLVPLPVASAPVGTPSVQSPGAGESPHAEQIRKTVECRNWKEAVKHIATDLKYCLGNGQFKLAGYLLDLVKQHQMELPSEVISDYVDRVLPGMQQADMASFRARLADAGAGKVFTRLVVETPDAAEVRKLAPCIKGWLPLCETDAQRKVLGDLLSRIGARK